MKPCPSLMTQSPSWDHVLLLRPCPPLETPFPTIYHRQRETAIWKLTAYYNGLLCRLVSSYYIIRDQTQVLHVAADKCCPTLNHSVRLHLLHIYVLGYTCNFYISFQRNNQVFLMFKEGLYNLCWNANH